MKRGIVGSALSVLFVALAVAGLFVQAPSPRPAAPTQADLRVFAQSAIDRTWESTGLTVERPTTGLPALELPSANAPESGLSDCMGASGFDSLGWGYGPDGGYALDMVNGSDVIDDSIQMKWYLCVTQHPIDSFAAQMLTTPSQRAAMYDYQIERLAPCLTLLGYDVTVPYTRSEAIEPDNFAAQWSAYEAVWNSIDSPAAYESATARCGEPQLAL